MRERKIAGENVSHVMHACSVGFVCVQLPFVDVGPDEHGNCILLPTSGRANWLTVGIAMHATEDACTRRYRSRIAFPR